MTGYYCTLWQRSKFWLGCREKVDTPYFLLAFYFIFFYIFFILGKPYTNVKPKTQAKNGEING